MVLKRKFEKCWILDVKCSDTIWPLCHTCVCFCWSESAVCVKPWSHCSLFRCSYIYTLYRFLIIFYSLLDNILLNLNIPYECMCIQNKNWTYFHCGDLILIQTVWGLSEEPILFYFLGLALYNLNMFLIWCGSVMLQKCLCYARLKRLWVTELTYNTHIHNAKFLYT